MIFNFNNMFQFYSINTVEPAHMSIDQTDIFRDIESFGFYSNINPQHSYYSPGRTIDADQIHTLNYDTWKRIVIRNAVQYTDNDILNLYRAFREVGDIDTFGCLQDDNKLHNDISIRFSTWIDNDFTKRLAAELELCHAHNTNFPLENKQYVSMFYFDDISNNMRHIDVSLSYNESVL